MGVKGSSEFAKTTILFPDFQDKKFVQGQFVDALCGFSNLGDKSFNITNLKGYLISPYDYSMYIQNFSEVPAYTEVKKGEEGTLMYRFLPDPALEPREYMLTLTVDYIDADKEEYQTAFFNSTIEIVESQSALDSRVLFGRFLTVCFLGILGLVGNAAYSRFMPKRRKTVDTSARSKESSQNEWLQGTFVGGQKSSSGNKKKSK
ncbi:hypothetical protein GUITHDRAFT_76400 [Guillardia theta CCMP2712]|uniref:Uncharacterized protein n=2 Tax=Guillardia theta TaxID=55529 RepID=L1IT63_GUITC|nr:hypothetical protein GUITHDRAFT_76400 [Guillardia theta CCMP2712]EKX39456.1 hypothetical protein GUITHDRAFT_76400 [Guillardia theta CCMP2712]|eukprot:XP_005826436.1 hypothetical protein GUITHDRAFT_76400 [Guillardia theta CCMP2712]